MTINETFTVRVAQLYTSTLSLTDNMFGSFFSRNNNYYSVILFYVC